MAAPRTATAARRDDRTAREQETYLWSMFRLATPANPAVPLTIIAGDYDVFRTAKGATGQGFATLTDRETNLENAGQLPANESWVIHEIGFAIFGGLTPDGMRRLAETMTATIETTNWKLGLGPMMFWPGGIGASGFSQIGGAQVGSIGVPHLIARKKLKQTIVFRGSTTFTGHFRLQVAAVFPAAEQVAGMPIDAVWLFYGRRVITERLRG